jgi:DNA-binding transcriptional ArsR family regulator
MAAHRLHDTTNRRGTTGISHYRQTLLVHVLVYYRGMETLVQHSVLARFGYALSDPVRACILLALRDAPSYPSELAELAGVSKQRLSNHLTCLRGCGLVIAVPEGRRVRYELADRKLGDALTALLDVVAVSEAECCCTTPDNHIDGKTCC